jgi:hypothetical protein
VQPPDLLSTFVEPLENAGISYMVTGSVASSIYGEARLTMDVDLVLQMQESDIPSLHAIFKTPAYYLPPDDLLVLELKRENRAHFNILHMETGLKADCYPIGNQALQKFFFGKRVRHQISEMKIWMASIEYGIISKLLFFREGGSEKHLRDIRSMIQISGSEIDSKTLNPWLESEGLMAIWKQKILASV